MSGGHGMNRWWMMLGACALAGNMSNGWSAEPRAATVAPSTMTATSAVKATASAPEQTFQGEIVDPAAYLREGRHGPETTAHVYETADSGQTLALLTNDTQRVYVLLAENPGDDPNDLFYDHIGQQVTVTGRVYERGGLTGIVVSSVESPESTEPASNAPEHVTPE